MIINTSLNDELKKTLKNKLILLNIRGWKLRNSKCGLKRIYRAISDYYTKNEQQ